MKSRLYPCYGGCNVSVKLPNTCCAQCWDRLLVFRAALRECLGLRPLHGDPRDEVERIRIFPNFDLADGQKKTGRV